MNITQTIALIGCLLVSFHYQGNGERAAAVSARDDKGIFAEVSEKSFTTESDEKTGFERKNVVSVTLGIEDTEFDNRWDIELTEEEIDLLAKILWVEARGESDEGQKAIVEVVFNRMVSEEFPDTLYEVLSQKKPVQFASWKLRDTAVPTEKEYNAIYDVLSGQTDILREDTIYFATSKLTSDLDVKIEHHYFCF